MKLHYSFDKLQGHFSRGCISCNVTIAVLFRLDVFIAWGTIQTLQATIACHP